jgi:hypothetical protein
MPIISTDHEQYDDLRAQAAAAGWPMEWPHLFVCGRCKRPFTARRTDAKYCRGACRVAVFTAKRKAAQAEAEARHEE